MVVSESSDSDREDNNQEKRKTLAENFDLADRIAPITCLSICDSMLVHAYVDGSVCAFDLATNQSFPLKDSQPTPFFPPLSSDQLSHIDQILSPCSNTPLHPSCGTPVPPEERHISCVVTEPSTCPHTIPVESRQQPLSPQEFEAMSASGHMCAMRPIVMRGMAKDWGSVKNWTIASFASGELGAVDVSVTGREGVKTNMPLREYIARFRGERQQSAGDETNNGKAAAVDPSEVGYLRGWVYEKDVPDLVKDVEIPSFSFDWFSKLPKRDDPYFRWIFIGPGGSKTPLHVDPCFTHAWLAQIFGQKRFILYRPSDLIHLYDTKGCTVDIRAPNREAFPTFDRATPFEVILDPGDVLFVPAGWAHQVECVSDSVSVTHNWLPKQNFSAVRACLLANRLGKVVTANRQAQECNDRVH